MRAERPAPGDQFGMWLVVGPCDDGVMVLCRCRCGTERPVNRFNLAAGKSRSCGCGCARVRGVGRTPEYHAWWSMIDRCSRETHRSYHRYGGRGIAVCDRWIDSFDNFLSDMGPRPSSDHSIDRIDNDGDYEPANCRWATRKQQSNNRCQTILLTIGNETRSVKEWSEVSPVSEDAISARLKDGWSTEDAVMTPPRRSGVSLMVTIDGSTRSASEWSALSGTKSNTIRKRLRKGYSAYDAVWGRT
jgi:hypothetical protein